MEMGLALEGGRSPDERWHARKDGSRFWWLLHTCERSRRSVAIPEQGAVMASCAHCGQPFEAKRADAKFCSPACKQAGHRAKLSVTKSGVTVSRLPPYLTPQNRQKPPSQTIEIIDTGVTDKPISKKVALRFEPVNSVTIKVTDGETRAWIPLHSRCRRR
jgi:hypothetical protein